MTLEQSIAQSMDILSSVGDYDDNKDLLTVKYTRVQKESPEYFSTYEGVDQNVDIKISTVVFRAAPEPVIQLYNFIMTTFVPQSADQSTVQELEPSSRDVSSTPGDTGKIRVVVNLASVKGMCLSILVPSERCVNIIIKSSSSMHLKGSQLCHFLRQMRLSSCIPIP